MNRILLTAMAALALTPAFAQQPNYGDPNSFPQQPPNYPQQQAPPPNYGQPPAPVFSPVQLDGLVGRIALYPDPLLAQVLTASTFAAQIPDAAGWARAHAYLNGGEPLQHAIMEDNLPWDPSVIALLPFPNVLDSMARDMNWTQQLGDAVLANRIGVMDAVQRQRQLAMNYGYLRTNGQIRVYAPAPGDIEILPVDPAFVYVPYYNPYVVFARPRPGFVITSAIGFGPAIGIGVFAPWGWGTVSFGWRAHTIIVANRPWERTWVNRQVYVHPYANLPRREVVAPAPRMEHHELREYRAPAREEHRDDKGRGREERRER